LILFTAEVFEVAESYLCNESHNEPTTIESIFQFLRVLSGVLKTMSHRAHILCDSKDSLLNELGLIKDVFEDNGYPRETVESIVQSSWEEEIKRMQKKSTKGDVERQYFDVLHAPYIKGFSEKLQKELKQINVGFVMKKTATIGSILCNTKPKTAKENYKGIVYSIACASCGKEYIGETSKTALERRKQHQSDVRRGVKTNGIFCHLEENPDHVIKWENQKILEKEQHWLIRKIKESIHIEIKNPGRKLNSIMNLERGISIDSCWKAITSEINRDVAGNRDFQDIESEVYS
jgi:hypothetical protein